MILHPERSIKRRTRISVALLPTVFVILATTTGSVLATPLFMSVHANTPSVQFEPSTYVGKKTEVPRASSELDSLQKLLYRFNKRSISKSEQTNATSSDVSVGVSVSAKDGGNHIENEVSRLKDLLNR